MKEYIKIPFCTESIDSIQSFIIKKFKNITNFKVINKKIDIKYLREIYKYDFNFFLDLVKELSMRGFEFYPLKESNIIPSKKYENIKFYIEIKENKNIYKDIHWDYFQLYNFIERFNIDSDMFFNKIPLEGFKVINKNINLDEFIEYLKRFENIKVREEISGENLEIVKERVEETFENIDDEKEQLIERNLEELKLQEDYLNDASVDLTFLNNVILRTEVIGLQKKIKEHLLDNLEKYSDTLYQKNIEGTQLEEDLSKIKNLGKGRINKYFEVLFEKLKEMNGDEFPEIEIEKIVYPISEIFKENKYNQFRGFLKEQNIKSLLDITEEILNLFKIQPKIGQLKYNQALSKWKEEQIRIDPRIEKQYKEQKIENYKREKIIINEMLKDKCIKISSLISLMNGELNNTFIDELDGYTIFELLELGFELEELRKLKDTLFDFKGIGELFEKFILTLKTEEIERLNNKIIMNKTLEMIAKEEGVTRERIRQKIQKSLGILRSDYYKRKLGKIIKVLYSDKSFITAKAISTKLLNHSKLIIEILKDSKKELKIDLLKYLSDFDIFILKNIDEEKLKKELKNYLPEHFELFDELDNIYEILEKYGFKNLPIENLENFLILNGYKKYKNIYNLGALNYTKLMEIIFKKYIKIPLSYNEEGFQKLKNIANNELDFNIMNSLRSLEGRIRDNEEILLVDARTFVHINYLSINNELIEKIEKRLENYRGVRNEINIEELFLCYEENLKKTDIKTKQALYSLLKFHYSDKYDFGKSNTLNIYFTENKLTREEIVLEILEKNSNIYTKQALLQELKWKEFKLEDTISKSNQLFYIGNDSICNVDHLNLSLDFKMLIEKLVMDKLNSDIYVISKDILEELQLEEVGKKQLLRLNINSGDYINAVIAAIMPKKIKIISRGKFLVSINSKIRDSEDIFKYVFKDKGMIYRDEIKEFYLTNGYAESSSSVSIQRLFDSNILSEIDNDKVILTSKFKIENETIESINNYINEEIKDKEYLILNNLKFRNKFKRIENIGIRKWNPYLLRTILLKNYGDKYKNIEKNYSDYRYDKVVITRKDSEIESFNDLIYFILKTEYEGQMQEDKIYDFLSEEKKILLPKTDILNKKLPYDIRNNNYQKIKIDELGRVEIL